MVDIVKLNKIKNPNKIMVGKKIELPGYVNLNAPAPVRKHKPVVKKVVEKKPQAVATEKTVKSAPVAADAAAPVVTGDSGTRAAAMAPIHIIEPGQDLNSIAMIYSVRKEDLLKLNNLSSDQVKVGQSIKIPPPLE